MRRHSPLVGFAIQSHDESQKKMDRHPRCHWCISFVVVFSFSHPGAIKSKASIILLDLMGKNIPFAFRRFYLDFVCLCVMRAALSCRHGLPFTWCRANDGLLPLLATVLMRVIASTWSSLGVLRFFVRLCHFDGGH